MINRLSKIRKSLTLTDGSIIYSNKEIIKLICRGFTNRKIVELAKEQFYYWDVPSYWENKKGEQAHESS
tara:strand:- start:150 stop:356 length:207 start_codon:yes stop_codon:yes gene_type:complete